jgi:Dolichyl-phosphate-mannose-protein mannosyltransferase
MKRLYIIPASFIVVKFLLQYLLIHPVYDLQRDEYLHLDQGLHLAWGYISVPPLTSWFSYLIHALGGGVFWVKFFPALFGAMTLLLVWKMIGKLEGGFFACILGTTAILISPLLRINTLYQPNSFDIFFWTLAFYILIRWIRTNESRWIYMAAITFAFGFYSKYNILILVTALFPAILLTPLRNIFTNKHIYIAIALTSLLIFPNLYWQYQNDFPTFRQLRELADTQLVHVNRFDFLKDQLLYFLNSLFIIIAGLVGFITYPPFRRYRVIAITYVFAIALFFFFRAKSYYAIGLYPVLLAFGAVYIDHLIKGRWKTYMRTAALALIIILFVPFIQIGFPNKSPEQIKAQLDLYRDFGTLRWEDGKDHHLPQDFADMLGWRELAEKVDAVYDTIQNREQTLVLCTNYGQAGAINFYSKHKGISAVSFNADYINWFPLDKPILNVISVLEADEVTSEINETASLFNAFIHAATIENPDAREFGTAIIVFTGAKVNINALIAEEIKSIKEN